MTLRELLEPTETRAALGPLDIEIRGIGYDSRRVRAGDAFFALAGARADGRAYARTAVAAGAVAVVGVDEAIEGATVVAVEEPRLALARAAVAFHGRPALALRVVAVTGTNGKTTTTHLLESIFITAGWSAGVIGTTGNRIAGERRPASLTTPEAPELQSLLAEMRDRGVVAVAMEMSSHALAQRRGFGLDGDVAVFTNLSHDHLDFHGTLDGYLDAKLMLFDGRNGDHDRKPWTAVINGDDPVAERVAAAARRGGGQVRTYGLRDTDAVRIGRVEPRPRGLSVPLSWQGGARTVALPLLGRYNAWNAAAAFESARALGIEAEVAARGLERVAAVPGRLERVDRGQSFEVVVDYAHTPDALEQALTAAREHAPGALLLVFGCGGDRDRAKRPAMGKVAAARADRVWVTSDNPRSEDPAAIVREIEVGMGTTRREVMLDRREAIAAALNAARPGDLVLIAGKGHETTQTIGDRVLPFDDREVAAALLETRSAGSSR